MKSKTLVFTGALAAVLSMAALGISAAVDTPRTLMSRDDYQRQRSSIEAEARRAAAACREISGTARDVCKAEARAQERVRKAELQAHYYGTAAASDEARMARVRAGFDVAKARCATQTADARVQCLRAAREDKDRALAQSRLATT